MWFMKKIKTKKVFYFHNQLRTYETYDDNISEKESIVEKKYTKKYLYFKKKKWFNNEKRFHVRKQSKRYIHISNKKSPNPEEM